MDTKEKVIPEKKSVKFSNNIDFPHQNNEQISTINDNTNIDKEKESKQNINENKLIKDSNIISKVDSSNQKKSKSQNHEINNFFQENKKTVSFPQFFPHFILFLFYFTD